MSKHQSIVTCTSLDGASIKFDADQRLKTHIDIYGKTLLVDIGQLAVFELSRALSRFVGGSKEG